MDIIEQVNELEFPDVTDTKKRLMLEALKKTMGIVSTASQNARIHRSTHYDWLKADAAYKAAVTSIMELGQDFAESKLFELMNGVVSRDKNGTAIKDEMGNVVYKRAPDIAAVIFYLKTKAKGRGYVERVQLQDIPDKEYDSTLDL